MKISKDELKELLYYSPESGDFTWNFREFRWFSHCKNPQRACNSWNARFSGTVVGYATKADNKSATKYIKMDISIGGKTKTYLAHILAYLYQVGKYPDNMIDHINQNGLDNSWKNLRESSHSKNGQNAKMYNTNLSGFNGVSWHEKHGRWQVRICANGETFWGGLFYDIEDAITKRKQMNIEHGFSENHGRII